MKNLNIVKIALSTSVLLLALNSHAVYAADDDTGWYAGIGASRLDANFKDVEDGEFDDSDNSLQIKLGYMFSNAWGLEFGYNNLGDYRGGDRIKLDADGYWLAGIGNYAVSDLWDIYGKLGASIVDSTSTQTIPGVGTFGENETETNAFFAVGAELDLGAWNIFGEWGAIDTKVSDLRVDILTLGVKYEFGR